MKTKLMLVTTERKILPNDLERAKLYSDTLMNLYCLSDEKSGRLRAILGQPEEPYIKNVLSNWITNECKEELLNKNFAEINEKYNRAYAEGLDHLKDYNLDH